uniref:Uncharacterized protein n=1 Tax=Rhipicephalus pulchellus TaxID=72859 RepID=L7LV35_RHIPC
MQRLHELYTLLLLRCTSLSRAVIFIARSVYIYFGNCRQRYVVLFLELERLLECAGHMPASCVVNLITSLTNSRYTHFSFRSSCVVNLITSLTNSRYTHFSFRSRVLRVSDLLSSIHFCVARHLNFPYQTVIKNNWTFVCLSGWVISV